MPERHRFSPKLLNGEPILVCTCNRWYDDVVHVLRVGVDTHSAACWDGDHSFECVCGLDDGREPPYPGPDEMAYPAWTERDPETGEMP